jgi:23S rRNA (adenine2030-N6)-methyltransferase
MNYRHAFHAGNFADVLKHSVLALLLKSLHRKDTPFCYLDTHAGAGRYDLTSEARGKPASTVTAFGACNRTRCLNWHYLAAVRAANADGALHYYPGSPRSRVFCGQLTAWCFGAENG